MKKATEWCHNLFYFWASEHDKSPWRFPDFLSLNKIHPLEAAGCGGETKLQVRENKIT